MCLIFSIDNEKLHAQNDHLEPVESIFDEYDFNFVYHSDVRKILMTGMSDTPEVRFLIIPSFSTEEVVAIENEGDKFFIVHHKMEKSIWYTQEKKEEIKVQKTKAQISKSNAQLYIDLFKAAISQKKYPGKHNYGLDGTSYYFSVSDVGLKTGTTWSQRKGTKMKKLVDIGKSMIESAAKTKNGEMVKLSFKIKNKIANLQLSLLQ